MTFQPPPPGNQPPPGSPPPPPGQWGPPAGGAGGPGGSGGFDPKSFNPLDWGIVGVSALLLIFSFFDYISVDAGPYSDSIGAWHWDEKTFITWFAMIFGVLAGAAVAAALFAPQVKLPVPARLLGLGLFAASFLLYLLGIFVHPDFGSSGGYSVGHGFSFWLSLILSLAGLALSLMRFQATGGQLPGGLQGKVPNVGGYGPQGGISGASGAPQPGYGQPAPPPPAGYGQQQQPPPPAGYGQQPPPPPGYGPPQ